MFAYPFDDQEERDENYGQLEAVLDEGTGELVLVLPLF
jgi:hypothetical protein